MEMHARSRGVALIALVTLAFVALGCAGKAVAPEDGGPTPADGSATVGIVVEEGVVLNGRLFGAENDVVVILSHMRPNDQRAWFDFAQELADEGYAALTFDFRGYGESDGDKDFAKLDDDLAAAVRYMRDRGRQQIFLVGASMGGTASLVVAAEQDVDGVVSISSPARFEEQDAADAAPKVTAAKLFIASEDDTAAMVSLDELLDAAAPPKESQIYPGNAHGTNLFEADLSENAAAIRQRILGFLAEEEGS